MTTKILEDVRSLIDTLEEIATTGLKKFTFKKDVAKSSSSIYLNEIMNSNEILYAKANDFRIYYSHFDVPNYIRSSDDRVCNHIELTIDRQKKFSSILSSSHAKVERKKFISKLRSEQQLFERMIQMQFESTMTSLG